MSDHAGQDSGTLRVTIREAAARLGVTEAAIRKRIQRGAMDKEMGEDGRVYVYLPLSLDKSHPESQIHRDPLVEELIEELRDRVAYLERSLERRSVEVERYQQIVAGLTQTNNQLSARVLQLEAPTEPTGPAESHEKPAQEPAEATPAPGQGTTLHTYESRSSEKPWWRRVFGG
jgi:hypothetical protein